MCGMKGQMMIHLKMLALAKPFRSVLQRKAVSRQETKHKRCLQGCFRHCSADSTKEAVSTSAAEDFYAAWNRRDIEAAMSVIADDCVYEDVVFQDPFVGKEAIRAYFAEIVEYLDKDVQFVIEDLSRDPAGKIGLRWHVEVDGIAIPFSRGCSFVRVNAEGKIIFARDVVEPTIKPGHNAMKLMTIVIPLVRRILPALQKSQIKEPPIASALVWGLFVIYVWYLLLSPDSPGDPVWLTSPDTIARIVHESTNIFYLNVAANAAGLHLTPSIAEHPVDEAIFNFVAAWGLMFLPVMLADGRSKRMKRQTVWGLWIGTWFLTNFFFLPYHAMRLSPIDEDHEDVEDDVLVSWSPAVATVGVIAGVVSIFWLFAGRPEFGNLSDRLSFLTYTFAHDRVFNAFCIDIILFAVFQSILLNKNARLFAYIPFFGLASHLFSSRKQRSHSDLP